MADETSNLQKLFQQSREALEKAYCPYSSFAVGAALLCEDGKIITGKLVRLHLTYDINA